MARRNVDRSMFGGRQGSESSANSWHSQSTVKDDRSVSSLPRNGSAGPNRPDPNRLASSQTTPEIYTPMFPESPSISPTDSRKPNHRSYRKALAANDYPSQPPPPPQPSSGSFQLSLNPIAHDPFNTGNWSSPLQNQSPNPDSGTFLRDSSETENSPLTPIFRSTNGNAPAFDDLRDFGYRDDRRHSAASITTASSSNSKSSQNNGIRKHIHGLLGRDHGHGENGVSRNDSDPSLQQPGSREHLTTRSRTDSASSRHLSEYTRTRAGSPSASRPLTPLPSSDVAPWMYQQFKDIPQYGQAPVRKVPIDPDSQRYLNGSSQLDRRDGYRLPISGRRHTRSKEGKPPSSGSVESISNPAVPPTNHGETDPTWRLKDPGGLLSSTALSSSSTLAGRPNSPTPSDRSAMYQRDMSGGQDSPGMPPKHHRGFLHKLLPHRGPHESLKSQPGSTKSLHDSSKGSGKRSKRDVSPHRLKRQRSLDGNGATRHSDSLDYDRKNRGIGPRRFGARGSGQDAYANRTPQPEEESNTLGIKLDDIVDMTGIVRTDQPIFTGEDTEENLIKKDVEKDDWKPPDSWEVTTGSDKVVGSLAEVDNEDDIAMHDDKGMYFIRVFRIDSTFATLCAPLNATVSHILGLLGKKSFLQDDLVNYQIVMRRNDLSRQLEHGERPILIQKKLLEQVGYQASDHIEDVGRDDHSYICRFVFLPTKHSGYASLDVDPGFNKSQKYVHVDLTGRSLVTIPITLYRRASEIITLNLSRNISLNVPSDFITSCLNLREIRFTANEALQLPPSFGKATRLTNLDISNNRLEQLDQTNLADLRGLVSFKIANNKLSSLPCYFTRYTSLRNLTLSSNNLKIFPDILCDLPSLVDLDISFNSIRELPNIGRLEQLERLWVTNNMLTGPLDESFKTLRSIKEIDARFNEITNVDSIMQLPRLEQLLLGHNAITRFKGSFPRLRTLVLDHCPISQFELDGPMNTLTYLNIASGKLVQLKDSTFDNLPHLTKLILDKNHFSSLSQNIGKLRRLEYFSMIKNTLSALPPTIGCLTELKYLNLRECNLDRLPSEIWYCLKLETLNVSSNLLKGFPKHTGQPPLAPGEYVSPSPATTPGLSNTPSYENMNTSGEGQSRRPSQTSNTLLSMGSPPIGRNNSVVSYITGGRKASTASRAYTDGSTSTRKDSNFSQRVVSTFSGSLRDLYLADNCLQDDIFAQLAFLPELRVLNLSYNELTEMPQGLLKRWQYLSDLFLSGNEFTSLPSDDLEETSNLKTLHINGNRFQVLPAELCKVSKLAVLDVGSNSLKYNVSNWPYDWNWNWNRNLRYLNFSGNKRLEIKPNIASLGSSSINGTDLTGFNSLTYLRVLGLMDVTLTIKTIPEETEDRRVRTSASLAGSLAYGMADFLGKNEHLSIIDMMVPRLRSDNLETLVGMFDGQSQSIGGSKIAKFLHENFTHCFVDELKKLSSEEETPLDALRRTFLTLNKDMAAAAYKPVDDREVRQLGRASTAAKLLNQDDINSGGVATVLYLNDMDLYVANVGDAQAVLVKTDGSLQSLTFNHDPAQPDERARIREAGGFVSRNGKLNDMLPVSRAFGYFPLMPSVIAAPHTEHITLSEQDEMIIVASKEVWEYVTFDLAVDVARSESRDLMIASQKIRDLAIAFGASNKLMVMILGISKLKDRGGKSMVRPMAMYPPVFPETALPSKRPRRNRDAIGDSRLARLDYVDAPVGELAIIFTDIKKSTSLWETCPDAMRSAIQIHNEVLRRQLANVGGYEVKTEGDAFMVAFATPSAALWWCFKCQLQLLEAEWPKEILEQPQCKEFYDQDGNLIFRGLSVRMGTHWGEPVCEKDPVTNRMDYFGPMVNRASRISAVADGGQIFVSSDFMSELDRIQRYYAENERSSSVGSASDYDDPFQNVRRELHQLSILGFEVRDQGERKLKGLENPEPVYQISPTALSGRLVVEEGISPTEELNPVTLQVDSQLDIDPNFIWGLWDLTLRLERLCSCLEVPSPLHHSTPKGSLRNAIQNGGGEMTDSAIIGLLDIQITRLETSVNTLQLRHMMNPFKQGDTLQDHAMPMGEIFAHLQSQLAEFQALKQSLNLTNAALVPNPQTHIGLSLETPTTDRSEASSSSSSNVRPACAATCLAYGTDTLVLVNRPTTLIMASGMDDYEYLSSGFDLSTLTVPRLRAILVSHDIPYPSSAKKAQLIKILEDEVLPKAKKLLRERDHVRRTSAGIMDMSNRSNNDELNNDDDGRDSMPPPPATPSSVSTAMGTRRGRSRQSTRASTADTEDSAIIAEATPKRRVRSSRTARASDAETPDDNRYTPSIASTTTPQRRSTAGRKPRQSEAIPSLETIEQSPTIKTESRASSIFTDENPFQSGSSPTTEQTPRARTISGERKQKSTPRVSAEGAEQRRSRVSGIPVEIKREYDGTPRKPTFEFPVSRLRTPTPKMEEESEDDAEEDEAGEEFTPDEQLALETAGAPSDRVMTRRSQKSLSYRLPSIVLFLLLAGFGAWWRQEKIEIGFCGVGKSTWSLADTNVPEWANVLEPQCEPCPPHAFCYQNFVVQCENDFILKHHPFSLNGYIPIPPTCEPDSEKSSRILSVANKAVEELRQRRAKYECGDGEETTSPSIPEPELKEAVASQRRVKMTDAEFDDLWAAAIGEIIAREEVSINEGPSHNTFSSSSLARLPIGCSFRRHLRLSLVAYRLPLSAVVVIVAGLVYVRAQFLARKSDLARVPELVGTTLDRLSTQAALYARGEAPEPWISIGQLRDDVLRSELRGSRREGLWKRVRTVVEGNANVRAAVREGRGGDVARVWEWIGSIGTHLDAPRRDSGRVRFSLSPGNEVSPGAPEDSSVMRSPRESRKWDEGRPIY
ncbi:adenylate cyclase [Talaromyces islandicus]|uniref:Adenylate cyclase n=1 Tax=Talaromyces islandicus TaxID=28573 RepID=A0A0U1M769_TALIS|nr:adenylate cyclase [Talaromyces islandicus]